MDHNTFMSDITLPGTLVVAVISIVVAWRCGLRAKRGLAVTLLGTVLCVVFPALLGAGYVLLALLMKYGAGIFMPGLWAYALESGVGLSTIAVPLAPVMFIGARIRKSQSATA